MTKSNKKIFILFFFVTTFLNASPIVDIETVRQSGEIGKFRNLEFSLASSRGNEDRDDFDIGIALVNNSSSIEKLLVFWEKLKATFLINLREKMDLATIQFLFLIKKEKLLDK